MASDPPKPVSGRQARAAENDRLILAAAREVFLADPNAPMAAVGKRAGVGMSALYRRYENKEALLQKLSLEGVIRYNTVVVAALADDGDPWEVFSRFVVDAIGAGGGSLSRRLRGRFTVTDELREAGVQSYVLTMQLIEKTKAAGVLREDFEPGDWSVFSELFQSINYSDPARNSELKQRYLRIMLDGLRAPGGRPLPYTPPTLEEMARRFEE
jgi:AcrR family transcriptional regulator